MFEYGQAFARNLGLIREEEQQRLRRARVAIAGAGGMGSAHAHALARLGIGHFVIADPDVYTLPNLNRQVAATVHSLGKNKASVTKDLVLAINPEADVHAIPAPLSDEDVPTFLADADVVMDGLDIFAARLRRRLFAEAQRRGIPVVSAGPIGFGAVWFVQTPSSMPFDTLFGIRDGMSDADQVIAFLAGIAGQGPHLRYMETRRVESSTGAAPSVGLAVQVAAGAAAAEVIKLLLGRGRLRPTPWIHHFDPYALYFRSRYHRFGGRHPVHRLKVQILRKRLPGVRSESAPG